MTFRPHWTLAYQHWLVATLLRGRTLNTHPRVAQLTCALVFYRLDTLQSGLGATGLDETNGIYQVDVVYKANSGRTTVVDGSGRPL